MTTPLTFDESMIAPCGINCGTCMAFLRDKNKCFGCNVDFDSKKKTCTQCKIKNCEQLAMLSSGMCYECDMFPCEKIVHMDTRYRTKYRASTIKNLVTIKEAGMETFLNQEQKKWTCPKCGSTTSVHWFNCPVCSHNLKSSNN